MVIITMNILLAPSLPIPLFTRTEYKIWRYYSPRSEDLLVADSWHSGRFKLLLLADRSLFRLGDLIINLMMAP